MYIGESTLDSSVVNKFWEHVIGSRDRSVRVALRAMLELKDRGTQKLLGGLENSSGPVVIPLREHAVD